MSLNLEEIRKKLDSINNPKKAKTGEGKSYRWSPKETKTFALRIVNVSEPFVEASIHFIGGKSFLCPRKNFNEKCAICEMAFELYNTKDAEKIQLAKDNYFPRERYFSPILVRGEEDQGVRWWSYGKGVYKSMLEEVLNPDVGNIADEEKGFDVLLSYEYNEANPRFSKSSVKIARRPTPIMEDYEVARKLVADMPTFNLLYPRKTPQDVEMILSEHMNQDVGNSEGGTEKYGAAKESETILTQAAEPPVSGDDAIDAAFEEK